MVPWASVGVAAAPSQRTASLVSTSKISKGSAIKGSSCCESLGDISCAHGVKGSALRRPRRLGWFLFPELAFGGPFGDLFGHLNRDLLEVRFFLWHRQLLHQCRRYSQSTDTG